MTQRGVRSGRKSKVRPEWYNRNFHCAGFNGPVRSRYSRATLTRVPPRARGAVHADPLLRLAASFSHSLFPFLSLFSSGEYIPNDECTAASRAAILRYHCFGSLSLLLPFFPPLSDRAFCGRDGVTAGFAFHRLVRVMSPRLFFGKIDGYGAALGEIQRVISGN